MSTTPQATYISSYVTEDTLVELVYNKPKQQTQLAVFARGQVTYHDRLTIGGVELKPMSPRNDLLRKDVILFPSMAVDYQNEKRLLEEIQQFIHRYLDISPFFETLATYYGTRSASENRNHAAACDSISRAGRREGAASPRRAAS